MDLSVTIKVTQDIVADFGFSFQLNAYSPKGANCVWQQYCIGFDTTGGPAPQLGGAIDNWPAKGFDDLTGDLINHGVHICSRCRAPSLFYSAGYEPHDQPEQRLEREHHRREQFIVVDQRRKGHERPADSVEVALYQSPSAAKSAASGNCGGAGADLCISAQSRRPDQRGGHIPHDRRRDDHLFREKSPHSSEPTARMYRGPERVHIRAGQQRLRRSCRLEPKHADHAVVRRDGHAAPIRWADFWP